MTQRVALACQLPHEVLEKFSEQFHLELIAGSGPGQRPSRHEILAALDGCDALIVAPPIQVDQPLLDGCPETVRAIGTYSVGHDHIDLAACRAKGMPVSLYARRAHRRCRGNRDTADARRRAACCGVRSSGALREVDRLDPRHSLWARA